MFNPWDYCSSSLIVFSELLMLVPLLAASDLEKRDLHFLVSDILVCSFFFLFFLPSSPRFNVWAEQCHSRSNNPQSSQMLPNVHLPKAQTSVWLPAHLLAGLLVQQAILPNYEGWGFGTLPIARKFTTHNLAVLGVAPPTTAKKKSAKKLCTKEGK